MSHFTIVLILYINLLNFSWIKMSILGEYGAFNNQCIPHIQQLRKCQSGSSVVVIVCPCVGSLRR